MTFLDVWIGYAIFGVTLFSLWFVWAVRNRQFSNLDRGRYIPLEANSEVKPGRVSRMDTWGLRLMLLVALGVFIAAIVVGIRNA